jgi:mRNA-degrading endonuclease RelE of RelBE toxin-antitoxin system
MRRITQKKFRVEIAPAVWREIGAVPGEAFKRMQAELENIAELAAASPSTAHGRTRNVLHRVRVDGYEGIYEVDADREMVRLVSVYAVRKR